LSIIDKITTSILPYKKLKIVVKPNGKVSLNKDKISVSEGIENDISVLISLSPNIENKTKIKLLNNNKNRIASTGK
jgi:hypothetical protein